MQRLQRRPPPQNTPRRVRNRIERPLPWVLTLVAGIVVIGGLAMLLFNGIKGGGGASGRGAFYLISLLGVLALLLIGVTFFYTARKRRRGFQEHLPGSMMAWFKSHQYLGVLALLVVLVHILVRPISSGLTSGKLALIVFVLLVLSGIVWRLVYLRVPKAVADKVGNLAVVDSEKRLAEIAVEIDKIAAGRSAHFQAVVHARLQGGPVPIIEQQAATLPPEEREAWGQVRDLANARDALRQREVRQRRYQTFLQRWKVLHIPLAILLGAFVVWHILDVFGVGKAAFGGEAKQFPSSRACASCHGDIVREWHQSVMSEGVTSPLMIAQVQIAVQKNKEAGHPLGTICTACHGPIGTAFTNKDILPFTDEGGTSADPFGGNPDDLVLNEGVTCIVCHALDEAPPPGAGAQPLPVNASGLTSLGKLTGPVLPGGDPIPVPDHQIVTGGYMGDRVNGTDELTSSNLCGACHLVAVDIDDSGSIDRRAEPGFQPDLVLQTTYDEWQGDYFQGAKNLGVEPQGCVACHAPARAAPIVDSGLFLGSAPERVQHDHAFVGVDYNLTPGHPGLSDEEFQELLDKRDRLLQSAALFRIAKLKPVQKGQFLQADVEIQNIGDGHALPTGFAFVRQMWIEISAEDTTTGEDVCLANVRFSGNDVLEAGTCSSGDIGDREDLPYCDDSQLAAEFPKSARLTVPADVNGKQRDVFQFFGNRDIELAPGASKPPGQCDPWLVSWQKILTDAPNPKASDLERPQRHEVGYQTLDNDIVAARRRTFDNSVVAPLDAPGIEFDKEKKIVGDEQRFTYFFLANGLKGDEVTVTATLHFRHTSPYFLRSLDGFYPDGLTADHLIQNLLTVDMATATADVTI